MQREPPASGRRTFARWLIGTEPVALVLLLALAVLLLALTVAGFAHRPAATPPVTTAAVDER